MDGLRWTLAARRCQGGGEDRGRESHLHEAEQRNTSSATKNTHDTDRDHTPRGRATFTGDDLLSNGGSGGGGDGEGEVSPPSPTADSAAASAATSASLPDDGDGVDRGGTRATVVEVNGGDGLDGFERSGGSGSAGTGDISDLEMVDVAPGSGLGTPGGSHLANNSR